MGAMIWWLLVVVAVVAVAVVIRFFRLRARSIPHVSSAQAEPILFNAPIMVMTGAPPGRWGHKKMGAGYKLTVRNSTVDVSCPLVAHHVFDARQTKPERVAHHAVTGTRVTGLSCPGQPTVGSHN